jgi:hypothetical protein
MELKFLTWVPPSSLAAAKGVHLMLYENKGRLNVSA